ncbi:Protein of unknown function [Pseudoxanthomonas sp. GM95]|uniref:DUF1615 domain-containing protein n=1 Tax=Pseudoxanthomonas sp. GM95 TaxID=1881043 RepID=UPI0008C35129|nr:DUF1615 domain-containing protein [Pseudoxanthomonas sp. GM95]SEM40573.1 Protein of unknown function [Pseudoxanthomonas sp. GM95]
MIQRLCCLTLLLLLAGCATQPAVQAQRTPTEVRAEIVRKLPAKLDDRQGWAADVYVALTAQDIEPSTANLCAVLAVAEQESTYNADPPVPGLPRIARAEIDRRADALHLPNLLVDAALRIDSPDGRSYAQRLEGVRTERDMSELYEDFIGMVPLGGKLFGGLNPVHTGGPMQVSIDFAQAHARGYPYALDAGVRHEVFTRRGGLYFGTTHLLGYPAHYDAMLYRFADFNAGWYASRNAAFQNAVSKASGIKLALDGDLLLPGASLDNPGSTERAVRALGTRLGLDDAQIRRALQRGDRLEFEETALYTQVFALADAAAGKPLPRAVLPGIVLESPKITRQLTTAWFADRVNTRWQRCMQH